MPTTRQAKVGHLIREIVSKLIQTELRDPGLGFVTVTDVEVSPDIREARIFVSVMGDDEAKKSGMAALKRATPFIRREVGHRAQLRIVPEIHFKLDESIERGAHIFQLLEDVKKEDSSNESKQKED